MTDAAQSRPIGVLGATGQQGGAVIDALLSRGAAVRAIVRDPGSSKSTALAARGVEITAGDQNDAASLVEPMRGLSALFVMTTFTDESGTEGEVRRGITVADAAVTAGVPRVVFSSVGGADRNSGVPHFESKWRIEEHLRSVIPTLVVRPVFFMDNLDRQLDGDDDEVVVRFPMPSDVGLQMIAVRDVGRIAAAALLDENALGGPSLEIAGDTVTGDQLAAAVSDVLGRPARYESVPLSVLPDDDLRAMFRWFVETPAYAANFDRTRELDPDVLDVPGWLAQR